MKHLVCVVAALTACQSMLSDSPAQSSSWPFESVTWDHGNIVAVLSRQCIGYYLDRPFGHISPGETLVVKPGSPVTLFSHMASFTASVSIHKRFAGLRIDNRYRTSVRTDEETTRRYFIQAR